MLLCNLVLEGICGLESRDIVDRDDERRVLTDIAGGLLGAGLYNE